MSNARRSGCGQVTRSRLRFLHKHRRDRLGQAPGHVLVGVAIRNRNPVPGPEDFDPVLEGDLKLSGDDLSKVADGAPMRLHAPGILDQPQFLIAVEKNLVADPSNLGSQWRPNCVEAAKVPTSRYSTFAFLAGTLQDGCQESLPALMGSDVSIDFIKGRDKRRNRARSWFWQKAKKKQPPPPQEQPERQPTLAEYVRENETGGREELVGGRISLAHEDAEGYARALFKFIAR